MLILKKEEEEEKEENPHPRPQSKLPSLPSFLHPNLLPLHANVMFVAIEALFAHPLSSFGHRISTMY